MQVLYQLSFFFLATSLCAQTYSDFIGAGHMRGVTVATSHNQNPSNAGDRSVDGFPYHSLGSLRDASRFLAQSTLGYDYETIENVATMGYEAWLDEQFLLPRHTTTDAFEQIGVAYEGELGELFGHYLFRAAWWNVVVKHPDLLRQRVAWALSQVMVTSSVGSDLFEDVAPLSTAYYDLLMQHAFGNYRDLLEAVSKNLSMGLYLSHFENPRSNPDLNIHPDENYAREVMQLFSIGLYELNNDGSRKLDQNGNFIPTYDNDDIREFAKIFTGFGDPVNMTFGEFDDEVINTAAYLPMRMYDDWHEPGEKRLLNGQIVPAGQTGLKDVSDAMDNLYNHPNVGPFIGKALIQLLVAANPSPAYINRVASAFNDNGLGVRGDMKAVVKAILLDPEARDCDPGSNLTGGKLREPLLRYTGLLKAFNVYPLGNNSNVFVNPMFNWQSSVGQSPQFSPSVFNFYQPEFQPNGPIADQQLVGPVFQIHNSSTSIGFINETNTWLFENRPFTDDDEELGLNATVALDFTDELALLGDPVALVNRLDILLGAGQLSIRTKEIIATAVGEIEDNEDKLDMAIYLIMISPDYAILK